MKLKARIIKHWGKRYRVTPRLIDKVFGDGKQMICVVPLNTRPNFYVIRIDSKIDVEELDAIFLEAEDGVFDAIEDQYGRGCGDGEPFPAIDLDCGYSFGGWEDK